MDEDKGDARDEGERKGATREVSRHQTQNEGDGRIGSMPYNGSDSLSILSPADNLVMQPLRDLVRVSPGPLLFSCSPSGLHRYAITRAHRAPPVPAPAYVDQRRRDGITRSRTSFAGTASERLDRPQIWRVDARQLCDGPAGNAKGEKERSDATDGMKKGKKGKRRSGEEEKRNTRTEEHKCEHVCRYYRRKEKEKKALINS